MYVRGEYNQVQGMWDAKVLLCLTCPHYLHKRYGQECTRPIIATGKSFLSRYVDYLMEKVRACKPAAADYIANIDKLWQESTDWNACERQLPPRYGIVTSNTSKCVNNMFGKGARDLGWLEAVDKLVDVMSTRIFQCRMKQVTREATKVACAL